MKIQIIRGTEEIGGNIIEIAGLKNRILLDAGEELEGFHHPVDFEKILRRGYDAIVLTHYHEDHLGLLERTTVNIPVYIGEKAFKIYRTAREYRGLPVAFHPAGFLKDSQNIRIGEIQITPVLADHSAYDAYSLILREGKETVLYTGDFRSTGWLEFQRYLDKLPHHPDALICEGTTIGVTSHEWASESDLARRMHDVIMQTDNQVFVISSAMNVDRIHTVYQAMQGSGRILLENAYMAGIADASDDISIPRPGRDKDVRAFTFEPLRDQYPLFNRWSHGRKISTEQLSNKRYVMCLRATARAERYLVKLNDMQPLIGSTLIYSMWKGYMEQPAVRKFLQQAETLGIRIISLHTSGHASEAAVRKLIEMVDPVRIFPVHTEHREWFIEQYGEERVFSEE